LYLRENTLMAQPFDEKRLAQSGEAVPVAEQVRIPGGSNVGVFTASRAGLLAYHQGAVEKRQLTWFDRSGKPLGTLGDPSDAFAVELSPDHKAVAVMRAGQNVDLWIYDVARVLPTRAVRRDNRRGILGTSASALC
jgi:hypothetical protein